MTRRTFAVFDEEKSAKSLIPLLGHVVANPRRPLDGYFPNRSQQARSQPNGEANVPISPGGTAKDRKSHETPSASASTAQKNDGKSNVESEHAAKQQPKANEKNDGDNKAESETKHATADKRHYNSEASQIPPAPAQPSSDLAFLEKFEVDQVVKSDRITADNIRSAGAKVSLEKVLGMDVDGEGSESVVFTSNRIRTLALEQYPNVFEALKQHLAADLDKYLESQPGKKAYLMVTLKVADKLKIVRQNKGAISGSAKAKIPVTEAATGSDLQVDPEVSAHIKLSRSSALNSVGESEVAFAAEYCEIVRISTLKFGLRGTVSKGRATRLKNVMNFSGSGLAFGNEDDEESDEDEYA